MTKAIFVPADDEQPLEERYLNHPIDDLEIIAGAADSVDLPSIGPCILMNSQDDSGLSLNFRATTLWWYGHREMSFRAIVQGDALIVGALDQDGYPTDVPDQLSRTLLYSVRFGLRVRLEGSPEWTLVGKSFDDYFDAVMWTRILLERWRRIQEIRIEPLA